MSAEEYARLPIALLVRELRFEVQEPGRRTQQVTVVTTLRDAQRYPKRALAKLYGRRWQVETGHPHCTSRHRWVAAKPVAYHCCEGVA
jgi:hypothetical protein